MNALFIRAAADVFHGGVEVERIYIRRLSPAPELFKNASCFSFEYSYDSSFIE